MRFSDLLQKMLNKQGIQYCFGIAGAEAEAINFSSDHGIRFFLSRHEFTAGVMADVAGRLLGKPQLAWSTFGPGLTNMSTGACSAVLDRSPTIFASPQVVSSEICYNRTHQCIDNVRFMEPLTKSSHEIVAVGDAAQIIETLVEDSISKIPGPTYVSIPLDILKEEVPDTIADEMMRTIQPGLRRPPMAPDKAILANVAAKIAAARNPLIVVGNQVIREDACGELLALVDNSGIPVICTLASKGAISEEHPLFLTAVNKYLDMIYRTEILDEIFGDVDLLLLVGYDFGEDLKSSLWRPETKTIVLNAFEIDAPDVFRPGTTCLGDVRRSLTYLSTRLAPRPELIRNRAALKQVLDARTPLTDNPELTDVPAILRSVSRALGERGVLCSDIGLHKQYAGVLAKTRQPNRFLCSNVCGSFGFGLPAGLAAKVCLPDERVIVVAGDGGFHSVSQDLETAARYNLGVVILVLNDSAFGLIEYYQRRSNHPANTEMVRFGTVDFCKLAEANGVAATRVATLDTLDSALEEAFASGGPHLIEIPTKYDPAFR
ncbi:thiamine pyrophosphate-binding protein [Rhizobium ruizarguesonis]|uniref:thiamine pyrophosphate-binding protein n=1 Tax=Rhizobium ruizarguesonis TaxID=2081791 RepID=UPI0037202F23